jgi:hypothetical protein
MPSGLFLWLKNVVGKDRGQRGSFFDPCKVHMESKDMKVGVQPSEREVRMMKSKQWHDHERQLPDRKPETILLDSRFTKKRHGPPEYWRELPCPQGNAG